MPPFCSICGDPVAGAIEHDFVCFACAAERPSFDRARSAVRYDGVWGEALRLLKYRNGFWALPDLAELLAECVRSEYAGLRFDVVLPVPLHWRRRWSRGYNQSELLAEETARRLGCPMEAGAIRRVRFTSTQTRLTAKERRRNVQKAFLPHPVRGKRLKNRRVLLVDDVMTTGATVDACARAARRCAVRSVHVATVARG